MSETIYQLIPKVMADVGVVGKSGFNTFDKYKFRSIDDVYNALQPVLAKHGVFIVPRVISSNETSIEAQSGKQQIRIKVKVEYKICAPDGSSVEAIFEGEGIDRSDKATNKAVQASFKYMCSQLFCLAFEGMDDADKETIENEKPKSKPPPVEKPNERQSLQKPAVAPIEPKLVVNHAAVPKTFVTENDVDEYKLAFNWGTFRMGTTFAELGVSGTKQLLTNIQEYRLKADAAGKPIPPQFLEFDKLSKLYLGRFQ